jgi:hypothetical protein
MMHKISYANLCRTFKKNERMDFSIDFLAGVLYIYDIKASTNEQAMCKLTVKVLVIADYELQNRNMPCKRLRRCMNDFNKRYC